MRARNCEIKVEFGANILAADAVIRLAADPGIPVDVLGGHWGNKAPALSS